MWPYDASVDESMKECVAEPRPKIATALQVVEVSERVVVYRGRPLVAFDEIGRGGRFLATGFSREEFAALVSCFVARAITLGLTVESVSVEDVLWHLDMVMAKQHGEPHTPF
jgi:hypothetical protein